MAIDFIKIIRTCEKECELKKTAAASNARHIISSAKEEAAKILEQRKTNAQKAADEKVLAAQKDAQKKYDEILKDAQQKAKNDFDNYGKNTDAAVDIIIKRVVKHYGNS